jgi:MOSC domain-containing protein YiiM
MLRRFACGLARITVLIVLIRQIFISPGHNYFGHYGQAPDDYPLKEVDRIECVAGHGIRGDRFYDYKQDYKGQITFFSKEIFDGLCAAFPHVQKSPGVLRRNVIVTGVDLHALIGETFELQGVRLRGTGHCKPCYWLDQAFAPGTEAWLQGNGGLRAQILTDGWIKTGAAELTPAAAM